MDCVGDAAQVSECGTGPLKLASERARVPFRASG